MGWVLYLLDSEGVLIPDSLSPANNLWPIGLGCDARHALGIIPGETYREPQATSQFRMILKIILKKKEVKLQAPSCKLWIT